MQRFFATVVLDAVIQARARLYVIGLGLAVAWGLAVRFTLDPDVLRPWLAPLLAGHIGSTTYFFLAALVIFERDQATPAAQSVTPLRFGEYLGSKLLSLSLFGALESVVLLAVGGALAGIRWGVLFGAIAVLGGLYGLLAYVQALPCRSLSDFLVPSALIMGVVLVLPIFPYFGVGAGAWWYLFPTYGAFLLLVAATVGLPITELWAAFAASAVWATIGAWAARRAYVRRRTSLGAEASS